MAELLITGASIKTAGGMLRQAQREIETLQGQVQVLSARIERDKPILLALCSVLVAANKGAILFTVEQLRGPFDFRMAAAPEGKGMIFEARLKPVESKPQ